MSLERRLTTAAKRVREAIQAPPSLFPRFPRSGCQAASKLLAKYLVEVEAITPVEAVANGERVVLSNDGPVEQDHFWLECCGFIIDITADQFEGARDAVIVTADRRWHDGFVGQTRLSQAEALNLNDFLMERYARLLDRLRG